MKVMMLWSGNYNGWNILGKGFEQSSISHGLCSISAVLKNKGHECHLVDMRGCRDWTHFEKIMERQVFDVAMMGFYSVDEKFADKAIRITKKYFPNKPIVVGGVHITYNQVEKFSLADCVVHGEGEQVMLQLIKQIESGKQIPSKIVADMIEDLDSLPFVDRGLFGADDQQHPILPLLPVPVHTINFSRGCSYHCSYCLESKNTLWKKYRYRSAENCIEELLTLGEIGSIMAHDDIFPMNKKWLVRFIELWDKKIGKRIPFWLQCRADIVIRNKELIPELARIGMTWASVGIEGAQRFLNLYNKKLTVDQVIEGCKILHDNDINIFGNYIVGSINETEQDIDELEEILKIIKPEHHSSSIYTSYSGSVLFDYISENNLWLKDDINDPDGHYSMTRFPYERKLKYINYTKLINKTIPRLQQHKSDFRIYKEK